MFTQYSGRKIIFRLWDSPTFMTWGSFASKSLTLFLVLPLVLTRLETSEIALWYLFSTIISLQMLADIGFSPTFSRVIAYAMAGASTKNLADYKTSKKGINSGKPNWETIEAICSTMRAVYSGLTLLLVFVLATIGTWSLIKPVTVTQDTFSAWLSWGIILFTSTIVMRGNTYSAYLQGINQIALLRRWEMFTSLAAIATNFAVLLLGGGLLGLIVSQQAWVILNILRNRFLCRKVEGEKFKTFKGKKIDSHVFQAVWPSTWRSGLGIFMSQGLIQLSGIVYAQVGASAQIASYLMGLRLIQTVSQFSMAPFYSKIPLLAKIRASGDLNEQLPLAQRGMRFSYWAYVFGFIVLSIIGPPLLILIKSNVQFPDKILWSLLGLAMLAERYGAMHIQLYSTTNNIIWHKANGISGILFLSFSFILFPFIDLYAFPLSILLSYLLFYNWYSAFHSYKCFNLKFWEFEKKVILKPLIFINIFIICYFSLKV